MSLTPLINIHSRISPRIFEKIWNDPNGILRGPRDTDLWQKTWRRKSRVRLPLTAFLWTCAFHRICLIAACAAPCCFWTCLFYRWICCQKTFLSYGGPVLLLDVSVLQQPVLPLQPLFYRRLCYSLNVYVLFCLWTCICSKAMQPVLPMNMSAVQPPVLPLDMSIYYLSLSCPLDVCGGSGFYKKYNHIV